MIDLEKNILTNNEPQYQLPTFICGLVPVNK